MPRTKKKMPASRGFRPAAHGPHDGRHRERRGPPGETALLPSLTNHHPCVTSEASQQGGLTLAQEAHQTSRHDHSFWHPNSKLREIPVIFRSAGISEPLRPKTAWDVARSKDSVDPQTGHTPEPEEKDSTDHEDDAMAITNRTVSVTAGSDKSATIAAEALPFFTDLTGRNAGARHRRPFVGITSRPSSPESSSSEEVILFCGRNRSGQVNTTAQAARTIHVEVRTQVKTQTARVRPLSPVMSTPDLMGRERRNRGGINRGRARTKTSDDSILDDYIANLRENGELGGGGGEYSNGISQPPRGVAGQPMPRTSEGKSEQSDASDGAGATQKQNHDDGSSGDNETESEVDDETLAKLFSGQSLDPRAGMGRDMQYQSDSDSTDNFKEQPDEFDLMDWERPSLQPKKGKKKLVRNHLDEGDSEMEQRLQAAWQNDRTRKKQRKQQREENRRLGTVGHRAKPDDLRVKYPNGMSTMETAQELRSFLMSRQESLAFPPMDIHARKLIHNLANQFNVKSKSTGQADQRRTTLFRTKRTTPFIESKFDNAMGRIRRRQLPRPDGKKKRPIVKGFGACGSHAAASYRDGEVVGGAAAELGTENRGRAMLERMGWSSGTALGASNNKGILQPVTHTMKRTKAGLG